MAARVPTEKVNCAEIYTNLITSRAPCRRHVKFISSMTSLMLTYMVELPSVPTYPS